MEPRRCSQDAVLSALVHIRFDSQVMLYIVIKHNIKLEDVPYMDRYAQYSIITELQSAKEQFADALLDRHCSSQSEELSVTRSSCSDSTRFDQDSNRRKFSEN